jgi:excinuclease UvrABC nuclease subunit
VFAALKTLQELRDEVHYFNMNQHEDDQRDILLRLIQIQAIIRMKLYSVFSSTQELQSLFLSTYNAEFFKTGTQVSFYFQMARGLRL